MQLRTQDSYALEPGRVQASDAVVTDAFGSYQSELYSFLRRSTNDPSAAEDLLQEAFLRLTREVRAGRAPDNTRAWLYQVAANLVVSRARRASVALRWLKKQMTFERARPPSDSPEDTVLQQDQSRAIERVLNAQPEDLRTALLMAGQGFSGREIATALGRSETATRSLLSRGRVRVRLALKAAEGAL